MRITKTFTGVFLMTFLIGVTLFYLIPTTQKDVERIEKIQSIPSEQPALEIEKQAGLKVFDVESFRNESEGRHNINFLETGEVSNGEDIRAKSGEIWWGLFNENGKDVLRPTKIKVKSFEEEGLWKDVSVNDEKNPIFLVKDKKKFKTGTVKTLLREKTFGETDDFNESATIREGFNKKFYLGNIEYTLRVEKGVSTKQKSILVLLLETENMSQIIHFIYDMDEYDYVGNLYWVGDLDHDGKLDLYMDFYGYEKGYYSSGLFLSSEARKRKLVGKFEYFMLGGC